MKKEDLIHKVKAGKHYLIKYIDAQGVETERFIVCLFSINKHTVYLQTYCYLRDAKRTFRIDRIKNIRRVKIKELK